MTRCGEEPCITLPRLCNQALRDIYAAAEGRLSARGHEGHDVIDPLKHGAASGGRLNHGPPLPLGTTCLPPSLVSVPPVSPPTPGPTNSKTVHTLHPSPAPPCVPTQAHAQVVLSVYTTARPPTPHWLLSRPPPPSCRRQHAPRGRLQPAPTSASRHPAPPRPATAGRARRAA